MCEKCYDREIKSFPTYGDFDEFHSDFTQKLTLENGLKCVSYGSTPADIYECQTCHTTWWFSHADLSWRGFFLKENSAKSYLKELANEQAKKDEQVKKGCLIFILTAIALVLIIFGIIEIRETSR